MDATHPYLSDRCSKPCFTCIDRPSIIKTYFRTIYQKSSRNHYNSSITVAIPILSILYLCSRPLIFLFPLSDNFLALLAPRYLLFLSYLNKKPYQLVSTEKSKRKYKEKDNLIGNLDIMLVFLGIVLRERMLIVQVFL